MISNDDDGHNILSYQILKFQKPLLTSHSKVYDILE